MAIKTCVKSKSGIKVKKNHTLSKTLFSTKLLRKIKDALWDRKSREPKSELWADFFGALFLVVCSRDTDATIIFFFASATAAIFFTRIRKGKKRIAQKISPCAKSSRKAHKIGRDIFSPPPRNNATVGGRCVAAAVGMLKGSCSSNLRSWEVLEWFSCYRFPRKVVYYLLSQKH